MKKKFGFVCSSDPFKDRFAWSGTYYKIREGLQNAGYDVVWIPVKKIGLVEKCYYAYLKICELLFRNGDRIHQASHLPFLTKRRAKSICVNETFKSCDALFFPGGTHLLNYMDVSGKPVVNYTDATYHCMIDYYLKNLNKEKMQKCMDLEKKGLNLASVNIYSSQWAANSAINDCGFDPKRCFVLEFGANLDANDIVPGTPYTGGPLNVFFSGVKWIRKGGNIAVETVLKLRSMGVDARLTIAGISELPDDVKKYSFIQCVGFLNKNDPVSYQKYIDCWTKSHLFILPTQAECSATVYCEAAGFGVPTYTSLTGGTGNYVIDGVNGRTFSVGASAQEYAEKIKEDLDSGNLKKFHEGALKMYETKLSWKAWSKRFKQIMDDVKLFEK